MNRLFFGVMAGMFAVMAAMATAAAGPSAGETYTLRYQFHPGETLRWDVEHRTRVRTSVSGTTETVETLSKSLKVWRVKEVKPDGEVTFEHSVEWLNPAGIRRPRRSACRTVERARSRPPVLRAWTSRSACRPVVTMDAKGKVLKRQRNDVRAMPHNEGSMTIPLPDEAVPVGYTWSHPDDIDVPLETGGIKKIKAIQQFTLGPSQNRGGNHPRVDQHHHPGCGSGDRVETGAAREQRAGPL